MERCGLRARNDYRNFIKDACWTENRPDDDPSEGGIAPLEKTDRPKEFYLCFLQSEKPSKAFAPRAKNMGDCAKGSKGRKAPFIRLQGHFLQQGLRCRNSTHPNRTADGSCWQWFGSYLCKSG